MPPLVVPGSALLRVYYTLSDQPWAVNVYGVANTSAVTINQGLANTLGSAIKGFFTSTAMAPKVASSVKLSKVGIRDINSEGWPEYLDASAAVAGSGAEQLPLQTALCVTLRTARAGKSYRGRSYLPGLSEITNSASGIADTPTRTAAVAFVNGIGSALSSNGMALAVVSQKLGVATPVTTVEVRDADWAHVSSRRTRN